MPARMDPSAGCRAPQHVANAEREPWRQCVTVLHLNQPFHTMPDRAVGIRPGSQNAQSLSQGQLVYVFGF